MRLDHIAYRTKDRKKTAQFFIEAFGYKIQKEFQLDFGDGTFADCIALEPPEKLTANMPWTHQLIGLCKDEGPGLTEKLFTYHLAPELFISDGTPGSIVGDWVAKRDGIGGIHHIAYQTDDVESTMREWKAKGYAEFTSDKPMVCEDLTQAFTKPSSLTNVIYEFIKRDKFGFCGENIKALMESTKGL